MYPLSSHNLGDTAIHSRGKRKHWNIILIIQAPRAALRRRMRGITHKKIIIARVWAPARQIDFERMDSRIFNWFAWRGSAGLFFLSFYYFTQRSITLRETFSVSNVYALNCYVRPNIAFNLWTDTAITIYLHASFYSQLNHKLGWPNQRTTYIKIKRGAAWLK